MKILKLFLYLSMCIVLLLSLFACTSPSSLEPEPEPEPRIMLDVECGWEMQPSPPHVAPPFPQNLEGVLKISESVDDFEEIHTFTGIRTPVGLITPHLIEDPNPTLFEGNAIKLCRYYPGYAPSIIYTTPFVSLEEDYNYLTETLNNLNFSKDISKRHEYDARVTIYTYKQENSKLSNSNEFHICADGIVLKSELKDGNLVYYESLSPVDYYQISALEIKYSQLRHEIYWKFRETDSSNDYRLCISGPNMHRDFTIAEARELLPLLLNINDASQFTMLSKINHNPPYPLDKYLKITEYLVPYIDEPTKVEEQAFYLAPDGKLRKNFRTVFAAPYENNDWEGFECNYMLETEETFDYQAFQDLFDD